MSGTCQHTEIRKPACKGWWWRREQGEITAVHVKSNFGGWYYGSNEQDHPHACANEEQSPNTVRYTGPIDVPEHTAQIAAEQWRPSCICGIDRSSERYIWGERLWEIWCSVFLAVPKHSESQLPSWHQCPLGTFEAIGQTAFLLRKEMLADVGKESSR